VIGLQLNLVIGMTVLALGFGGGLWLGRMQGDQKLNKLQIAYTLEKVALANEAQRIEQKFRNIEQSRVSELAEATDAAYTQAKNARADAQRAEHLASELRRAYIIVAESLSSKSPTNTSPASSSSATTGSELVLTHLFSRGDQILRQCAAALDQAYIAGHTCERAYDSLTQQEP